MSRFIGGVDSRRGGFSTALIDATFTVPVGDVNNFARQFSGDPFREPDDVAGYWPASVFLGEMNLVPMFGNGASAAWSLPQMASGTQRSAKYIIGRGLDVLDLPTGCVVKGYLTASDLFVGATAPDSNGDFELSTPYPEAHFLVAYRAGSPDIFGTTVNTLTPTNRDGT